MRKDEDGNTCPETLGEYRDLVHAIAPGCPAEKLMDEKIEEAKNGRDEVVIASDHQMRLLLMPRLFGEGN